MTPPIDSKKYLLLTLRVLPLVLLLTLFSGLFVDQQLSYYLTNIHKPTIEFFKQITHLGKATVPIAGSLLLFLFFQFYKPKAEHSSQIVLKRQKRKCYALIFKSLFFSLIFSGIIVQAVKNIVGRQRPYMAPLRDSLVFAPFNPDWQFHSFPSGHTQVIAALTTFIFAFMPKWRWPALSLALTIALSRIVTANHFLSDILFGGYIGVLGSLSVIYWLQLFTKVRELSTTDTL